MKHFMLMLLLCIVLGIVLCSNEASAIPAFSRKYNLGCNTCHTIYPQLNEFGRDFKNNGYRTPGEIGAVDSTDFWSKGFESLPVTVHGKFSEQIAPKGQPVTNFTSLDELQLNAAVNFSSKVSVYLHTHLWEDGGAGEPLVVSLRINDLFDNQLVSLRVGQYQLPLSFSPEIERLSGFDYLGYAQALGANPWTIDQPQLGFELTGNLGNDLWYWAGLVNGGGFEANSFTGTLDNNSSKDPYLRIAKNFGENTIGVFGYYGTNTILEDDTTGLDQTDKFFRLGCDIRWNFSNLNVLTSVLYGNDNNFNGLDESTFFYGGFLEGDYVVSERTMILGRYDIVTLDRLDADPNGGIDKTTWAVTPGVQYLVLPNIKLGIEYQFRKVAEEDRGIVALHFAL